MPLRSFIVGEIIAYSDKDSVFKYGIIKADVTAKSTTESSTFDLRHFDVQVDKNTLKVIPSTSIYSFTTVGQRGRESSSKAASNSFPRRLPSSIVESETSLPPLLPPAIKGESNVQRGERMGLTTVAGTTSPSPVTPTISTNHILQAVNDILSRANLSLDSDVSVLMERNISLRTEIDHSKVENAKIKQEMDTISTELERVKSSFNCEICFNKSCDRILVPCGHLLCSLCTAQLQRRICPFDRQTISSVMEFRIPFS
jgi:sacsin